MSGLTLLHMSQLRLVAQLELHSAFPFFRVTGPFVCQGQEIPVPDGDSRSLIVHLVCHSVAGQSGHLRWQSLGGFDSRIDQFLSVPDPFQLWLIQFPRIIRVIMSI